MIKKIIFFLSILSAIQISAQPNEEENVKRAVEIFFEGFHKGDTLLMKTVMLDNFTTQTAFKNKQGEDILISENSSKLINTIANRPSDQKWDERLLSFNIQVDGNMANVWTPYEFWLNDAFSHCGVNSFKLFNKNDKWKIIYLIDTRHQKDCDK